MRQLFLTDEQLGKNYGSQPLKVDRVQTYRVVSLHQAQVVQWLDCTVQR